MKKIWGILIIAFSLILFQTSAISISTKEQIRQKLPPGSSKKFVWKTADKMAACKGTWEKKCKELWAPYLKNEILIIGAYYDRSVFYFPKFNSEIWISDSRNTAFIFENVSKPYSLGGLLMNWGDGKLKEIIFFDETTLPLYDAAYTIIDPEYANKLEEDKKKAAKKREERKKEAKKREEERKKEEKKKKKTEPKKIQPGEVFSVASGTGFFINRSGHILSNNHVVDSCTTVKVHYKGNAKAVKILAIDRANDLSLMKSDVNPDDVFAISKEDAELMEEIWVAGYPFGKVVSSSVKINKGNINALTGIGDNYSNFQTDAPMQPGNSGGPIINQKGNVVGVAVAKLDYIKIIEDFGAIPEGTNFGIKSSTVQQFIKANNVNSASTNLMDMSNKDLGKKIQKATVYLDCWMTAQQIRQAKSRKVIFTGLE